MFMIIDKISRKSKVLKFVKYRDLKKNVGLGATPKVFFFNAIRVLRNRITKSERKQFDATYGIQIE
jgi:hypothetical protein